MMWKFLIASISVSNIVWASVPLARFNFSSAPGDVWPLGYLLVYGDHRLVVFVVQFCKFLVELFC
jgi:hypothetical protein